MKRVNRICELKLQRHTIQLVQDTTDIVSEVLMERALQDHQWGGPAADDLRVPADWSEYIHKQLSKLFQEEGGERDRFIKVAALAVAAVQSIDRKEPQEQCQCHGCQRTRDLDALAEAGVVNVVEVGSMSELIALLSGLAHRKPGRPG